jgi:hypothetical protein
MLKESLAAPKLGLDGLSLPSIRHKGSAQKKAVKLNDLVSVNYKDSIDMSVF